MENGMDIGRRISRRTGYRLFGVGSQDNQRTIMLTDLLAPERMIVQQLESHIHHVAIKRAGDLRTLTDKHKPQGNTIYVLFAGGSARTPDNSTAAIVRLRFVAVVAVRNVSDVRGGSAARDDAGPLAAAVIAALHHCGLDDGFSRLILTGVEAPVLIDGYFLLPLVFSTNATF